MAERLSIKHNTNNEHYMSAFTIFFIVVTLLYVIYYAAIITIDMNAKPKSESDNSETMDTEGMVPDSEGTESSEEDDEPTSTPIEESESSSDEQPIIGAQPIPDDEFIPSDAVPVNDNPYGLMDEEETSSDDPNEEHAQEPEEKKTPSEEVETPAEDKEPEVKVFEPEPTNGGLAVDINNSNESIQAESMTPCMPNMLASEVFSIMNVQHAYSKPATDKNEESTEQKEESTLSDNTPMPHDEESGIIDRI